MLTREHHADIQHAVGSFGNELEVRRRAHEAPDDVRDEMHGGGDGASELATAGNVATSDTVTGDRK